MSRVVPQGVERPSPIAEVDAQSGKKIDADDATGLSEAAEAMRESLGCGGG